LSPLLFRRTNPYNVEDVLNNDCFSYPLNIIINIICLAAGLHPDPLGGELTALVRP